jgi:hypothetical protein
MNKRSVILGLVLLGAVVTSVYAMTILKQTGAGLYVGTVSTQKVGFWGKTPITQPNVSTGSVSTAQFQTNLFNALLNAGFVSSTN